jgi:hypothetical protein
MYHFFTKTNAPNQQAYCTGELPAKFNGNYSTSLYRIALLIIAGIETNPGPRPPKYPCGTCSKACKWGERALACDECDTWYHASCTGINIQEYSRLANSTLFH